MKTFDLEDIYLLPRALFLKRERALVLSDTHIGFEQLLRKQGIQLPNRSYPYMKEEIKRYIDFSKPSTIILNGDIKEEFSDLSYQEFHEMKDFITFLKGEKLRIIAIRGNHDNYLMHFLEKQGVECHEQFVEIGDNFITHGHINLLEEIALSKTKRVIIGHEHPGIMVRDELFSGEKFKAFVRTTIFDKDIFVLPAFSPLKPGTELNIKNPKFLSPLLDICDLDDFMFYVNEDSDWFTFDFHDIVDK